jgi:rare lipoprotein A
MKTILVILLLLAYNTASAEPVQLKASWYSNESLKKEGTWKTSRGVMANGKYFDENKFTCATRLYQLGTILRITNINTGAGVTVEVTDRVGKRFGATRIDLSKRAFSEIADLKQGLVPIKVEVLK